MTIKKILAFCIISVILFTAGIITGYLWTNRQWRNSDNELRIFSSYLYNEINKNFGSIESTGVENKNIIDRIPFYKEKDFAIILEDGIKTIRIWE
jgi:hypothetical protein